MKKYGQRAFVFYLISPPFFFCIFHFLDKKAIGSAILQTLLIHLVVFVIELNQNIFKVSDTEFIVQYIFKPFKKPTVIQLSDVVRIIILAPLSFGTRFTFVMKDGRELMMPSSLIRNSDIRKIVKQLEKHEIDIVKIGRLIN